MTKWQNGVLWEVRLTIGNSIDYVLTKPAYKPLDYFRCMSIILGTCQEIAQEEADQLWYDGLTLLYVLYLWWPGLGDITVLDVCSTSSICDGQAWGTSRFLMSALRLVSAVARLGGHHGS